MHNPGEMNSERHYFALIGDIIDSRHEQDRYDVQKKLQSILSSVNAEHAAHIAADFLISSKGLCLRKKVRIRFLLPTG